MALWLALAFLVQSYAQFPTIVLGYSFRRDGRGNNVDNPDWGTEDVPLLRHTMPAAYYQNSEDGLDPTLPGERYISNMMAESHGKHKPNDVLINQLHLDWGHLITVDLVNTANGFPTRVPGTFEKLPIPPNDFWADESWGEVPDGFSSNCELSIPFGNCQKVSTDRWLYASRWFAFPGTGKGTGVPKAQYGDVTQWLDLSGLYGNPMKPQKLFGSLEMFPWVEVSPTGEILNDGKLISEKNAWDLSWFLQVNVFDSDFKAAADFRFNKTPGLRVLLETLRREHNRLVDKFKLEHPDWDAFTLFHEARRWVIAFYQSISFREYLAAATGEPLPPYTGYNNTVNPGIDHYFANVAFRYGHSAIPALIPLLDNNLEHCPFGAIEARSIFLPSLWYTPDPDNPWTDPVSGNETENIRTKLDHESIIRGLAHSSANAVDVSFVDDLRNFMSQVGGPRHGEDLISIDIFRSRDAGIPSYNKAREYLGLAPVNDFSDITTNKAVVGMLKKVYGTVDRIDAYVGCFAEDHKDLELGESARTSMQEQFRRLRDGDRFFYENGHFTPKEVEEIQNTKLTDLFLRNWPEIQKEAMPVNSFFLNERQLTAFKPSKKFPEPLNHPTDLPWYHMELSPVYQLYWAIDRSLDEHEITIQIQVQTEGWAGIGFSPDAFGSMKGADIVLCRLDETVSECRDSKAFDVGVPILDTDRGGLTSLDNVVLSRAEGILTAMFTRKMVTGDDLDAEIKDGTRIIFAFNPVTNDLKYHGPTRNPDVVIDFDTLYIGPPQRVPISEGITIFLYIICGIGSCLSIIYIIIVLTQRQYFRFQTPEFCVLVCVGSILGYISVLLILPDNQNDATCKAHLWFFGMSFWMVFLGFFIKVARVYYIIKRTEKTMEVTILPFWQLFVPLIVFMLGEMVFNICWDTLVPPDLERQDFLEDNTYVLYCGGDTGMWAGSVAFRATFLGLGSILAVLTKDMPQEFNWSKEIAACIYTSAVILFIGIPLGFALTDSASMVVLLKGLTIVIAYTTVTTIIHFDSLKRIAFGKGPREQTKTSHTIRSKTSGSTV